MQAKYDVVVCGSATIDVFADTDAELISLATTRGKEKLIAYPTGSKILVNDVMFEIGGGGTNTSVGFSRMGLSTGYVGCIGHGTNAELILKRLTTEKVDFLGHTSKLNTGYSMILDSKAHDRTILAYKGANNDLQFSKLCVDCFDTKWYYFSSMVGKSFKAQQKLAQHAKKKGIKVAFNPSEYQVKEGYRNIKAILDATDVLIFNRTEAEMLVGAGTIDTLMRKLHDKGVAVVCITDGPKATYASDGTYLYTVRPQKVKVVESTGAGDAFSTGFIASFSQNLDIGLAMGVGIANAQSVIAHHGAKNKLLSLKQAKKVAKKLKIAQRNLRR